MGPRTLAAALPLLALGLACGPATPPPGPQPEVVAPAEPAPQPAAAPEPPPPEAPPPVDPLAGLDADARWSWAVSQLPQLSELTRAPEPNFSLLRQKNGSYVLYSPDLHQLEGDEAPFRYTPCAPIELREEQGALMTRLPEKAGPARPDLRPSYTELTLGKRLELGLMVTAGAEATPLAFAAGASGPPRLSELTADRVRYERASYGRAVDCAEHTVNRTCADGSTSSCRTCRLTVVRTPRDGQPGSLSVETNSACEPCPPDPAPLVAPLNRVLAEHRFVYGSDDGVSFYRDAKACKAARAALPGPPADGTVRGFPRHPSLFSICDQHVTLADGAHLGWSLYVTETPPAAIAAWYRARVPTLAAGKGKDKSVFTARLPSAAKPERVLEIAPAGTPGPDCGTPPDEGARTIVRFSRMIR